MAMFKADCDSIDNNEDQIDAWHDGYLSPFLAKNPHGSGPLADAWDEGRLNAAEARRVRVQPVERPEGYYHSRLAD